MLLARPFHNNTQIVTIACVGSNNSKAEDEPDKFVPTPEEYKEQLNELIEELERLGDVVMLVGNGYVDETKTSPKPNPRTGGRSYITNARRLQFRGITKELCKEHGISFIETQVSE